MHDLSIHTFSNNTELTGKKEGKIVSNGFDSGFFLFANRVISVKAVWQKKGLPRNEFQKIIESSKVIFRN